MAETAWAAWSLKGCAGSCCVQHIWGRCLLQLPWPAPGGADAHRRWGVRQSSSADMGRDPLGRCRDGAAAVADLDVIINGRNLGDHVPRETILASVRERGGALLAFPRTGLPEVWQ